MNRAALQTRLNLLTGRAIPLDRLEDAYRIDHQYEEEHFVSEVRFALGDSDDILVEGSFTCTNGVPRQAGNFSRRLFKKHGILQAHHSSIRVARKHRNKHIATAHYIKALRFYDSIGLLRIGMEANEDGPTVWPGFAFELIRETDIDLLQEILRQRLLRHRIF